MPEPDTPDGELVAAAIDADSELLAIRAILSALVPLKRESRTRVLDYIFKRLGLVKEISAQGSSEVISIDPEGGVVRGSTSPAPASGEPRDIRSLKEQKVPKSANEMAALVAYYLADVATDVNRKYTISADDIKTYFKQANFKLPKSASMTLTNAKNAGYLEAAGTPGGYKLNPVGYNLVVHGLPRRAGKKAGSQKSPKKSKKVRK